MPTSKPLPEPPLTLTRPQVARLLGVSVTGLKSLEKRGIVKSFKLGGLVRFRREDLEATLAALANPLTPGEVCE